MTPGGGGLEMIPRLVGRSRALEIVIGADDFNAETAASYGCMLLFLLYVKPGVTIVGAWRLSSARDQSCNSGQ